MNGRPSCWKTISWPNWNFSIPGYSPWPLPAQRPISHASRAVSGWMFSGISKGMATSLGRSLGPARPRVSSSRVRPMPRPLVVKVTAGADDPERCNQGFTVSATAVAAGAEVSLWLTGEAAWFGVPGRAEAFALPHAQPLATLLATVVGGG